MTPPLSPGAGAQPVGAPSLLEGVDPSGAQATVSVRSRVNGPDDLTTREQRRRTLAAYAGREMGRRLLDGAGLRDVRARRCGWRLGDDRVFVRAPDGRTKAVAIERCAMGRICPVCGPAEAAVRAAETGAAVWRWMTASDEHAAVFVSIAPSHKATDRLEDLHAQLLAARNAVMRSSHRAWKTFRARYGITDLAWKVEHNVGRNGYHVGLHLILLTSRPWEAIDAQRAGAWLLLRLREELTAAGYTGRLSATHGIDLRAVTDPTIVARYLLKWGIGRELAAEADKLGRNGENVPLAAIPSILAEELGRHDPHRRTRIDRRVRLLVAGWVEFVKVATADTAKWYRGFRNLKDLVPELRDVSRPADRIAAATDVLPVELRPERTLDAETEEDVEDGERLTVAGDVWSAALYAWWRGEGGPVPWARRRREWLDDPHSGALLPLDLAVAWLSEDDGLEAVAHVLADLAGAEAQRDAYGWTVTYPEQ